MAKIEQIRASLAGIDSETVKDALSIILAKESSSAGSNIQRTENSANYKNFAQAILDLKKNYKFPELNAFTTEADLVYVQAGDRKI